ESAEHSGAMHATSSHRQGLANGGASVAPHMHRHGQGLDSGVVANTSDAVRNDKKQQGPGSSSKEPHLPNHVSLIERQHTWFAILGFCVALFKYLDDRRFSGKITRYPWAHCIIALGVSLVLYAE